MVPFPKAAAKGCCCAALAAENDDVVAESDVPIPLHEFDAGWGEPRKNPVVTDLLLDSTDAGKFRVGAMGYLLSPTIYYKSGLALLRCK